MCLNVTVQDIRLKRWGKRVGAFVFQDRKLKHVNLYETFQKPVENLKKYYGIHEEQMANPELLFCLGSNPVRFMCSYTCEGEENITPSSPHGRSVNAWGSACRPEDPGSVFLEIERLMHPRAQTLNSSPPWFPEFVWDVFYLKHWVALTSYGFTHEQFKRNWRIVSKMWYNEGGTFLGFLISERHPCLHVYSIVLLKVFKEKTSVCVSHKNMGAWDVWSLMDKTSWILAAFPNCSLLGKLFQFVKLVPSFAWKG